MTVRFGSTLAMALLLAGGSAQAQRFQYAAGTSAFDVSSTTKIAQEVMGQKQEMEITSTQLLTLGIARKGGDTIAFTVRIDSIGVHHSAMGAVDVSRMQGLTVSADLGRDGEVHAVQAPDDLEGVQADQLARLMPRVRGMLKVGTVWVDTLAGDVMQSGLKLKRSIITTSRVLGDTVANGERAWRISREALTSVAGSGEVQGQPMTVEGTGTGSGTWIVSGKGQYLGAALADELKTKVTMSANGMEVHGTTSSTTTVSRRGR